VNFDLSCRDVTGLPAKELHRKMSLACGKDDSVMHMLAGLEKRKLQQSEESRATTAGAGASRRRMSALPVGTIQREGTREMSAPKIEADQAISKRRLSQFMDQMKDRNSFRNVPVAGTFLTPMEGRVKVAPIVHRPTLPNQKQDECQPPQVSGSSRRDHTKSLKDRVSPIPQNHLTPLQTRLQSTSLTSGNSGTEQSQRRVLPPSTASYATS
jgi:hypothetical protein